MKKHVTPILIKEQGDMVQTIRTSAPSTKNGNAQKQKASNWKERRKKTFTPKIINASILIKMHSFPQLHMNMGRCPYFYELDSETL